MTALVLGGIIGASPFEPGGTPATGGPLRRTTDAPGRDVFDLSTRRGDRMDLPLLTARLIHIVLGIFWAGTLFFNALFLLPAVRDAGPDGAKVAAGLMRRRFLDVLPWVAILTVLAGFWLYWRVSDGFSSGYMRSSAGMAYGLGAVSAVLALAGGLTVVRPSMLRAAALSQAATAASPPERESQMATAQALRARAAAANRIVAGLLTVTAVTMALGRYL